MPDPVITRFAPSPTGRLHLGHAYSALQAYNFAREKDGRFILRIEDIDRGRCRPEFELGIYEDLEWLGLRWEQPVRRQSEHFDDYGSALDHLAGVGLLYPCFCTRKEIAAEIAASPNAPHGPEGALYPGTCKALSKNSLDENRVQGKPFALRLNVDAAVGLLKGSNNWPLFWRDEKEAKTEAQPQGLGDVVLGRKDIPASYHLAVTLDDALQGITHVIRGQDLLHATHIHRLLQALFDLPTPIYVHHKLILDQEGARFAKRRPGSTLFEARQDGQVPCDLRKTLGQF